MLAFEIVWLNYFSCVPALRGDRSSIHANLCSCLLLGHLLLLTGQDDWDFRFKLVSNSVKLSLIHELKIHSFHQKGLDATSVSQLCYAIAVVLHYLFMSAFCWMLAEELKWAFWQIQNWFLSTWPIKGFESETKKLFKTFLKGWHIYRLLTDVWQTSKFGMVPYYVLGYVIPALIVIIR